MGGGEPLALTGVKADSLPGSIRIDPPDRPLAVEAAVVVPGSKSVTNRALVLAALASGPTVLQGALWSDDTQVMVESLKRLGFEIGVERDPREPSNRTIRVHGQGGVVPAGGSPEAPLELFVGNAGTAARFLTALACLGHGSYRLDGVPRMRERPQAPLFQALRQLGYAIDAAQDQLPAIIHGRGPRPGSCQVSIEQSSQFASALLLCSPAGGWQVTVIGENADESPYVRMSEQLVRTFPARGGAFDIEADASSGTYFIAADILQQLGAPGAPRIRVLNWPGTDWQVDARFPQYWPLPPEVSRQSDLGDSIMMAIGLAPFARHPVRFTDLGRLRLQECERVKALRTELTRCGAQVRETGDTLEVQPSALHGARIETYDDHRMAMVFSILGLRVRGLEIQNPACVRKTFPNFYAKLGGLGWTVRDTSSGRVLSADELNAD